MSQSDATQSIEGEDRWYVQLPTGEVRTMTLDQLVGAYEADLIDGQVYVLAHGETTWQTLAEVADLGTDDAEIEVDEPAPLMRPQATYAHSVAPSAPTSWAPQATGRSNTLPAQFQYAAGPSYVSEPRSTTPVSFDSMSEIDLDDMPFKKRRSRAVPIMATLAMLGGIAFAGVRYGAPLIGAAAGSGGSMAASLAATPEPTPAVVDPVPTPVAGTPAPGANGSPAVTGTGIGTDSKPADPPAAAPDNRLSDEAKRALAAADKNRDAQQKARQDKRQQHAADSTSSSSHHSSKKVGSPFTKGGDKYDPLNASL